MRRPQLVVMLKVPRPGRVKTRLGREIGMVSAAWWFRHQAKRLLRRMHDPRWDLVLAVSPDHEGLSSRVWPTHPERIAQGPGDLGDRMSRVFRTRAPGPVCIVGADIPGMNKGHVKRAFTALGDHDAVLGPATDGGYWLVGLKRVAPPPATLFEGVRWSTEHALADTLHGLRGLRIAFIDTLRDIDTAEDLRYGSEIVT